MIRLVALALAAGLLAACAGTPDPAYQHLQAACGAGALDACAVAADIRLTARMQGGLIGANMMGY